MRTSFTQNEAVANHLALWFEVAAEVVQAIPSLQSSSLQLYASMPSGEYIQFTVGGKMVLRLMKKGRGATFGFYVLHTLPDLEAKYGSKLSQTGEEEIWYEIDVDDVDPMDFVEGMVALAQRSAEEFSVSHYRTKYPQLHDQRIIEALFHAGARARLVEDLFSRTRNFFLFQANPSIWDLKQSLENDEVREWSVTKLGKEMQPGDLVILWSTGAKRGAYGIARLTGEVRPRKKGDVELDDFGQIIDLEIIENWADDPVYAHEIEHFNWVPKNLQGTNFRSAPEVFHGLIEWRHRRRRPETFCVWKLAPGENSMFWDEFKKKGVATIGWDIGNLSDFNSEAEMEEAVQLYYPDDKENRRQTAKTLFAIGRRFLAGDFVVAKDGFAGYHGVGRITSGYLYRPEDATVDCHQVEVEWFRTDHAAPCLKKHRPTLIEITDSAEEREHVEQLYGFTFADTDFAVAEPEAEYSEDWFKDCFIEDTLVERILRTLPVKKNIILQGPPGTGKTFIAKRLAYALMGRKDKSRIETVQFHQSYSYEDFIQGFRPKQDGGFERRDGVFYRFCAKALQDAGRDYFFLIDEINRGNLSKIFGELMMLIEADKRGLSHQVQLTYSNDDEHFSIPENVHIIGTMNTADRSLAMVDYALRRRFAFFNLPPTFNEKFAAYLTSEGLSKKTTGLIQTKLNALNATIEVDPNLGSGFQIGHSYFCSGWDTNEWQWFANVIDYEVGPQLLEFWFDDKAKAEAEIAKLKSRD